MLSNIALYTLISTLSVIPAFPFWCYNWKFGVVLKIDVYKIKSNNLDCTMYMVVFGKITTTKSNSIIQIGLWYIIIQISTNILMMIL